VRLIPLASAPTEIHEEIEAGIKETQATVPTITPPPPNAVYWVVVDDDLDTYGILTAIPLDQGVEVGVRFWRKNMSTGRILEKWLMWLMTTYTVVVARVYPSNHRVKRLLQRGGFRLREVTDGLEYYTVTKDTFLTTRKGPSDG
jgi:hypothetical protein